MKTLFVLALLATFGGHVGMWYGATYASISLFNASFGVYVIAVFSTLMFGAVTYPGNCSQNS